jgi:hypothetical protein
VAFPALHTSAAAYCKPYPLYRYAIVRSMDSSEKFGLLRDDLATTRWL